MIDDTHPQQDIPEPSQPPQPSREKRQEAASWRQKAVLILIGIIAGAALVAGGYALAGNHSTNLAPLQHQVTALQQKSQVDQAELAAAAQQISTLDTQVTTLNAEYALFKLDGITTYNEACPIGGVWVPCAKNEPPGFGPAG